MALLFCLHQFVIIWQVKNIISRRQKESYTASASFFNHPKTFILGFSKGGTVLNQLVTELGFSEPKSMMSREVSMTQEGIQIVPTTKESLLNSITELHYIDVGLNTAGAYITDGNVIEKLSNRLIAQDTGIRFFFHGTPRQWCDERRVWIRNEKDKLVHLLESESRKNGANLQVYERFYFADRRPDMQMHFEIIESMNVS